MQCKQKTVSFDLSQENFKSASVQSYKYNDTNSSVYLSFPSKAKNMMVAYDCILSL